MSAVCKIITTLVPRIKLSCVEGEWFVYIWCWFLLNQAQTYNDDNKAGCEREVDVVFLKAKSHSYPLLVQFVIFYLLRVTPSAQGNH